MMRTIDMPTLQDGKVNFSNIDFKKLWNNLSNKLTEERESIIKEYELLFDIVTPKSTYDSTLRLVAAYHIGEKTYVTNENELEELASHFGFCYNIDRYGYSEDEYGFELHDICPKCKTEQRPMYDENPHLAHFCDCSRGRWDDQC